MYVTTNQSTVDVGRVAAEFLLNHDGRAALLPPEYATHQMAPGLLDKTVMYYAAVRVLAPVFGVENALSHPGPRILHGCMVAMAVNCWRSPDEDSTRGARTQLIAAHLRRVYTLIHHEVPGTQQYELLQVRLQQTLSPPPLPEEGMGELAAAAAWIAELYTRTATIRMGPGGNVLALGIVLDDIRSYALRMERQPEPSGRLEHLIGMIAAMRRWLEAGGTHNPGDDELFLASQAIQLLIDPAVIA